MTLRRALPRLASWDSIMRTKLLRSPFPGRICAFASSRAATRNMKHDRDLFEYTSGRWLWNEPRRLAERRLAFNVDELINAAAKAVDKPPSDVKSLCKLAEGGFNRVFDISMKDGSSILARLPYPSTLPQRLAVASEVTTMDLVRAHGVPAPRVLGYSDGDNSVGAEYILMERLPGRPIGDAWFDLSEKERLKILLQIVQLEAKLFAIDLPASGSVYYARDLPTCTSRIDIPGSDAGLCIGPYTAMQWWSGERGDLKIDRGPHTDPHLILQAPAEKELAWINAHGRPRFPFDRAYRETFKYEKQDPEEHADSLREYIRIAPHLVSTSLRLNRPVLRHPDLQPNNIFIDDDFNITGLIDWQHAVVLPMFLAAGMPNVFQNYDDEQSMSFTPPKLPDNIELMDDDDRARAQEQFRRRHIHFFYLGFTQRVNEPHWHALEQDAGLLKRRVFHDAGAPWEGLNTPLQTDIIRLSQNWPKVVPINADGTTPAFPIIFTEQEMQRRASQDESLRETDSDMERILGLLGAASDGWTPSDRFESAKEKARLFKGEGLAAVSDDPWLTEMSDRHWPFDDFDEDE